MASKSKRVKVVIENPTTGEIRTFNVTLTILDSDCPRSDPHRQRVVIIRRAAELGETVKAASESHLSIL